MKPKDKISDRLRRGDFVFSRPGDPAKVKTFGERYPNIAELEMTIQEFGDLSKRFYPIRLGLEDRTQAIDCTNPNCNGGGFLFSADGLWKAVQEHQTTFKELHGCHGVTRQRPRVVRCTHGFEVTGTIRYKDTNEKPPEGGSP